MTSKRVLIAPLDWGLGHATRCIPIINLLLTSNCDVTIAGSGSALALLKIEYPMLKIYELPGYNPVYSSGSSLVIKMICQLPKFLLIIKREHIALEKIVSDNNIDIVISDNRYGCWSSSAKSIFITHQLNILLPKGMKWLSTLLNYFNRKLISKYDACWVPDDRQEKLSGELSDSNSVNAKFIGVLSRFNRCLPNLDLKYKVIVVLSGPEPQRTRLEEILLTQLKQMTLKVLVVRGVPGNERKQISDNIEVVDFLNSEQLNTSICESEIVIARSGYSTIMDLMKLGKRAVLIPTPGQTEQEYLASELLKQSMVYTVSQNNINLKNDVENAYHCSGFQASAENENLLKDIIAELIK